ncbi:MAG: class I SAM-dependent methyltransferase [Bacteriovoracaceae bacterium]|nr:class I SAM-dependent methyltransferase [Bacteriovoracaceae bacterium]
MPEFVYDGTEVLKNLTEAVNYNHSLRDLVIKESLPGDVLDFGAGIGTFSDLLKDELNPKCLEIDKKQAGILKQKGFVVVDSLEENKYDYIYSLNVLEHIEDHHNIVKDLVKALKPGGKLLIFVPAFNILFSDLDKKVGHFRRNRTNDLRELLKENNTSIKKLKYFDFIGFFFALVFKTLRFKTDKINKRNVVIFDRLFYPLNYLLDPIFSSILGKNAYVVVKKRKD